MFNRTKAYRQNSPLNGILDTNLETLVRPRDAKGNVLPMATMGMALDTTSLMGITAVGLVLILASKFIPNRK